MTAQEKLEFYGHRRVLVGGKDSDDDDFIDEDNPLLLDQVGSWRCVSSSFETDADLHPSRKTLAQFDNNY